MNWEALQAVAELVAAFGVIVSLAYLARQVRGSSQQARASAVQALSLKLHDLPMAIASNRELSGVFRRGLAAPEALGDEDEQSQLSALLLGIAEIYEEMFYSWRQGLVEPWMWTSITSRYRDIAGTPGFATWWEARAHWFSRDFQEFMAPQVTGKSPIPAWAASRSSGPEQGPAG